jgi:hypothetical protein
VVTSSTPLYDYHILINDLFFTRPSEQGNNGGHVLFCDLVSAFTAERWKATTMTQSFGGKKSLLFNFCRYRGQVLFYDLLLAKNGVKSLFMI